MEKEFLLKTLERLNFPYVWENETTIRILEDNYGKADVVIEFDEQGNIKDVLVVR